MTPEEALAEIDRAYRETSDPAWMPQQSRQFWGQGYQPGTARQVGYGEMPPPPMDMLDVTAMSPGAGDVLGPMADARYFWRDPEQLTPFNVGASLFGLLPFAPSLTFRQATQEVPGLKRLGRYLTEDEKSLFDYPRYKTLGEGVVERYKQLPTPAERAAVATAGGAKRGWYADSERAIRQLFANEAAPDDPERFTALLAALSPQTSVQSNLKNALNTWTEWQRAGRPRDPNEIMRVLGRSVEGTKGEKSVLDAWKNNAFRALSSNDARNMLGPIGLSGPKVQSFLNNLMGISDEVTNDAWMAKLASIDQNLFGGVTRKAKDSPYVDEFGAIGIKGPGYLAENIGARRAAEMIDYDPMEVQETGWSFAKTLQDMATAPETVRKSMAEFGVPVPEALQTMQPMPAEAVLRGGLLSDEAIAAVPAFGDLVTYQPYRGILEAGGYQPAAVARSTSPLTSPYERLGVAPEDLARTPQGKHVIRASRRLDATTRRTEALGRVKAALELQRLAKTPKEKRYAAAELGRARQQLRRSVGELPNVPLEKKERGYLP